ncbi:hypothetical protein EXIGLDRAFT_736470 [Exidia glandulosa HHB12029]|uniref:Secreted protein n=1 Tax=Exidia glandulosa HHB12029 TaxID=1314781 RepID=A0A166ASE5_EXIGL|nr:hypothetical protein EXIGLDRAFT_736470 [Exidia glandulosa HHB12029]
MASTTPCPLLCACPLAALWAYYALERCTSPLPAVAHLCSAGPRLIERTLRGLSFPFTFEFDIRVIIRRRLLRPRGAKLAMSRRLTLEMSLRPILAGIIPVKSPP